MSSDEGIFRFSTAEGITSLNRYPNMLTNYGDFGALQRIGYISNTSSASNFSFLNIPQTYQDLQIIISATKAGGFVDSYMTFNGDYSANSGSRTVLNGDGSSATSTRRSNDTVIYFPTPVGATNPTLYKIDILNYRSSTNKTILIRGASDQNGSGYTFLQAGLKQITSAITQIYLDANNSGTGYATGSTAALYGIRAGNS